MENHKVEIQNMFSLSETKPKLPEILISRDQYLDLYDNQLEDNRVLCVTGEEGVGVTTTLALFAKRHSDCCASYFNNGWSRHLLSPQTIVGSLLKQLSLYTDTRLDKDGEEKDLTPYIYRVKRRAKKNHYLYFVFDGFCNIPKEYIDSIKGALAPLFNIKNGRFIFSGDKDDIKQLLPEITSLKQSNEVLKFQRNDIDGYLKKIDETLSKDDIETFYELCNKGEARRLTILTEILKKEGMEILRSYYSNDVSDLFENDYAWIMEQEDEQIVRLMALLTFSEIPQDKQSLMRTLRLKDEKVMSLLEQCQEYVDTDEHGIISLKSDDYRKYLRMKLSKHKTDIELLLIDMMEAKDDVEEQFLYLPALYKHVKKNEQLVNYLTNENVQTYLVNKKSQAALNEQCEYGYSACTDFESQAAAYFRFALNRSVSREIEKNELSDEEIEALISIGDDKSAYAMTQNVFLLEERLKCLLIIAQANHHLSSAMKEEIDVQITALTNAIDFEHIPNKALELAKLMLPVKLDMALEIIDKVARVTKDQKQIDRLYTAISLSYNNEGYVSNENQTKTDLINTRITDDNLRKMTTIMKSIMAESTVAQVVAKMKELPSPNSQLYFLRYWIPDHIKNKDIGAAVEYAVKLVIDTSTTSMPKVSFLLQFCKPLPSMTSEQIKDIVGSLDAVVANIKYPTVEYVQLMTLVISALVKHDKRDAEDRLQNLYLEITELKDKALQAHCKALLLRDYEMLGEKKDIETCMMPAFQLQDEIMENVDEILKNSAYHLKVVEGPIKALVCSVPSFVKEVISKMNTKERKDRAYLLAATEYIWQIDIKKLDWAYFLELFNKITYDLTELYKPLVALVDKVTAITEKDERLLENVRKHYFLINKVEQADVLCYLYATLYVWLCKNYAGEMFSDGSSIEKFKDKIRNDLNIAWNTINMPWLKMKTGYEIANVLSKISMKQEAREYVAKAAEIKKGQLHSSYSCIAAYHESLDLYVHSLGILIRSKTCTDEDLEQFKQLLSYDCEGESILQWAKIALEYYGVENMDMFNKIVNRYVSKPLDKFSRYYQKMILYHISPALFLSSKLMFCDRLKKYDTFFQNACFENIARYILTKYPYPEYNNSNNIEAQISIERKDYDYLMDLMEESQDEGFIFNYTDIISRSIKRDMGKTLSRELHKVLFDRLDNIVSERLPMKDGIQHVGYRIACKAMICGNRNGGIDNATKLKHEIENIPNKADQAFLYAHVAKYLKRTYEKMEFIELAIQKTEELDYTFDKFNRYSLCLQDSFLAAPSKSRFIAEKAMTSLKSDLNRRYSDYQKMIDLVRDHDEELAESMLEMVDDDPVRIKYKLLLKKRGISERRLKAAKEDMQQVARLNNEEQVRFFKKQMEFLIKKKIIVKDVKKTVAIISQIYENPITDTRNAVLFFMENIYQKNQANNKYNMLLRELHIAIVDNLKIVLAIASGTKEKLERVTRIMNDTKDENQKFIPVGESERGLSNIIEWYKEHPVDVLRIIDPYFHAEDLYIIKELMDLNEGLRCYILTHHKKNDMSLDEVFQDGWNAISSNLPGRIEVKSCCYENEPQKCPIHDRWWLLYDRENDKYYGMRMASPSTMGSRIMEMSNMDGEAVNETTKIWERFFNNQIQKLEGRKLMYNETILR